ncbi:TetR/AcrR family transcriptional regulator [Celeribacter neptunius]|uniref:Transcriptional regulator, TetR family n=1 Tax=Celeribacter neptunius TaxID=588602 RepID=A0A1I3M1U7_9RHOB|nr:TetR/AcrR family transcriptional regulator [Celeribacter neptunius]SFI90972.1 transcriptional regulator, TetR family [Celeribacter neptunius]
MNKPIQKRAIATREKLLSTARALIDQEGFEALRVEDLVRTAGVAKGTFFAHFKDKDALMEQIIGARLAEISAEADQAPAPQNVAEMVATLNPLIAFMTSERYVFDVILRYSGAAAISEIGPIAEQFTVQGELFARWVAQGPFRKDIPADLAGDGIGAFLIQSIALTFCALHCSSAIEPRLATYLDAWLLPSGA